jgi:hypothetical protein
MQMNKIKLGYLAIFQLFTFSIFAQTLKRVEIPVANNMEVLPIPMKEKGVIVLSQIGANAFNLKKYDTELSLQWNINGTVGNNLDYVTHCYDGKHVYLLFSKYNSNTYEIIKIFPGPGFIEKFQIFSIDKIELADFEATDNIVFLSGMVKQVPVILYTDLTNKRSKVLPTAFKSNSEVQSMELDTLSKRINITFAVGKKAKDYELVVKSFDLDGNAATEIQLNSENEFAMMNGRLNTISEKDQIMFGTYGYKNTIGGNKGPYSQGIYLTKITGDEIAEIKYYDFTDFKNYFGYLNQKQREKQEKKVADKKGKGKELKLSHRMLVHEVIKQGDKYILVAESFYPEYRYNNFNPYGFGGMGGFGGFSPFYSPFFNPYRWGYGNFGLYSPFSNYYGYRSFNNNRETFDGWNYTHGIVAAFDSTGNLLWDNSIEFKNLKTPILKEKIKLSIDGELITMSYTNKGEIFTKSFKNGITVDELKSKSVDTANNGDSVKRTDTDEIDIWYENYFLATGVQKIANEENGRRNVFYMNKVSF